MYFCQQKNLSAYGFAAQMTESGDCGTADGTVPGNGEVNKLERNTKKRYTIDMEDGQGKKSDCGFGCIHAKRREEANYQREVRKFTRKEGIL